ncbi:hypothetical protein CLU79DRAFT_469402 [Phycomyces nitens]|nr:hypothetical protein CLU79DRAFT_469402 [Phycomyces nitens]
MSHSFMEKHIPFKTSVACYEEYVSYNNGIRIGRILEDIDDIGGVVAGRHIERMGPSDICANYTVGIEQIYMDIPDTVEDYKITGHIAYTKNSLLIGFITLDIVKDDQIPKKIGIFHPPSIPALGVPNPSTVAEFLVTFIHIDSFTNKPIPIVHVKPTTFPEQSLFDKIATVHSERRRGLAKRQGLRLDDNKKLQSMSQGTRSNIDSQLISEIFVLDTRIESNSTTSHQYKNGNGTIFGGYIMRDAFELASTAAARFLFSPALKALRVNNVSFLAPIFTGEHIRTNARVIYSNSPLGSEFVVRVEVEKRDQRCLDYKQVVIMDISFASTDMSVKVKRIIPSNPKEMVVWLEGYDIIQQKNKRLLEFLDTKDKIFGSNKL